MVTAENRIDVCFAALKAAGKRAFVAYVCAGDPDMAATVRIVRALEAAGVDIVELGLPFSDPIADGIVNQMAADRALRAGATTARVLETVREIRKTSQVPLVLFTYLNPIYAYGYAKFHEDAARAGVDGILVLDLPPDEVPENPELKPCPELLHIQLIAPTSPAGRIGQIGRTAEGFVYYVSREGVTGARSDIAEGIPAQVAAIRAVTGVPVCVGFGISNPSQAAAVAAMADGVVVGSAIVRLIENTANPAEVAGKVEAFVKPLVDAVKGV